jgi:acyl-[acyl-carrier-protein] desaturase
LPPRREQQAFLSEPIPFNPAAARLDNETEAELYSLYRAYFADAEARQWNVWDAIPWEASYTTDASEPLVQAVLDCYSAELFLPDYMTTLLKHTRASRGRTWYVTHWCYEEGKHLLALGEWLTRRGLFTDEELQNRGAEVMGQNRWQAVSTDAVALFVDAILYETQEEARYRELRRIAEAEHDTALVALSDRILGDEGTQKRFFAQSLAIIGKRHSGKVSEAIGVIADAQPDPRASEQLVRGLIDA